MNKKKVYVTYDTEFQTWNVMLVDRLYCVKWGTAEEVDAWLFEHSNEYEEIDNV